MALHPSEAWCAELHSQAHTGDVVQLSPGVYPGGCVLRLGGFPEENEPFVLQGEPGAVIASDPSGLALRVEGVSTRVVGVTVDGRLEVAANQVTVDTSAVRCLEVTAAVTEFSLLFSEVPRLDLVLTGGVIRGNTLQSAFVTITDGVVSDNTVFGDLVVDAPAHRNLVLGTLSSTIEALGNVVHGDVSGAGTLYGNTLLGGVDGAFDARNNLTILADLGDGNLLCADCIVDGFDPRPLGRALTADRVDAPGDSLDYCRTARTAIGAVNASELLNWTVFDRDPLGCVDGDGLLRAAPEGTCPEVSPSRLDVVRDRGCATQPWPAGLAPWLVPVLWRRRCSRC